MSQNIIRWGVLGVAKINNRIFPSFTRTKLAKLHGIASRSLVKAQHAAKQDNIPKAYGSYDELLADPEIDVVYNPLPNTLHAEWTKKAADAGKHILCEKPLTPTAAGAQEVVDYCASKGVRLLDGFMWPHHPRTVKLREIIDAGTIGEVQRVTGAFTFKMEPLDTSNIRLKPELGGGSLLDVGCYPVYGIRWALGAEPVKAFAQAKYVNDVDVEMTGQLTFADGRMASFDCGFTLPMRMTMEITGTEGFIRIPEMWLPLPSATFTIHRWSTGGVETISIDGQDQIAHMLDNMSSSVRDDQPVKPEPHEAVKTLRVLDALAKSAKSGKIEDVAG
ncbi:MAG: Gfo/Idh/MocA family protein [Gemmataceae bacterium]